MNDRRQVAVTGVGLVSPLGFDEEAVWQSVLAGRSGIAPIKQMDVSQRSSRNGAEVDSTQLETALTAMGVKHQDRTVNMALVAGASALREAGLLNDENRCSLPDVAAIIASSNGPTIAVEDAYRQYGDTGYIAMRPTLIVRGMVNAVSSQMSVRFGLTGANYVIVTACSSSSSAMGAAFRMIRDGYADCVVTGGTDTCFAPGLYSAWDKLGVMSKETDPAKAGRPFDIARDGFVMGEGAAMMVVESMDHAVGRGATVRAEVIGFGESSDAFHMTRPCPEGQARTIRLAIDDAGIAPEDIGFINSHGTGTKANDSTESKSIRDVLGDHADNVPVTANKSFFGHTLGAAGAFENAQTIKSLETGLITPNKNLDNPDPECNLRFVGAEPEKTDATIAMKNSFGFGGNNAVLIFKKA